MFSSIHKWRFCSTIHPRLFCSSFISFGQSFTGLCTPIQDQWDSQRADRGHYKKSRDITSAVPKIKLLVSAGTHRKREGRNRGRHEDAWEGGVDRSARLCFRLEELSFSLLSPLPLSSVCKPLGSAAVSLRETWCVDFSVRPAHLGRASGWPALWASGWRPVSASGARGKWCQGSERLCGYKNQAQLVQNEKINVFSCKIFGQFLFPVTTTKKKTWCCQVQKCTQNLSVQTKRVW